MKMSGSSEKRQTTIVSYPSMNIRVESIAPDRDLYEQTDGALALLSGVIRMVQSGAEVGSKGERAGGNRFFACSSDLASDLARPLPCPHFSSRHSNTYANDSAQFPSLPSSKSPSPSRGVTEPIPSQKIANNCTTAVHIAMIYISLRPSS
jgi:hypothetical protein